MTDLSASPEAADDPDRIVEIVLAERAVVRRSREVEHERAVAIHDMLEDNRWRIADGPQGPYRLALQIADDRLLFCHRCPGDGEEAPTTDIAIGLSPFRRIVKDYFTVCESYYGAIKRNASLAQIEAIDMGRRGLHNEGSELLRDRLAPRVETDLDTARRLFTLVCVLHIRG